MVHTRFRGETFIRSTVPVPNGPGAGPKVPVSGDPRLISGATGRPRKVGTTGHSGKTAVFSHPAVMVHVPGLMHACCLDSRRKGPWSRGEVAIGGSRS